MLRNIANNIKSAIIQGIDGSALKPALILAIWLRKLTMIFGGFWGLFNASVTHKWFKRCFHIQKQLLERVDELTLSVFFHLVKKTISFGQKQPQKNIWLRKLTI